MPVVIPGTTPSPEAVYAGAPSWIELVTHDPAAAQQFYAEVFGWEYQRRGTAGVDEHIIALQDGYPVAGIRESSTGRSTWRLYLATEDVVAATQRAERFGAEVSESPVSLPGLGSLVVLTGPSDAEFGLVEPGEGWRFQCGVPGTLVWAELVTIQAQAADHFFRELFGYDAEQFGTDSVTDYMVWYLGDESVLARVSMIREFITPDTHPHWLLYFDAGSTIGTDEVVRRVIAEHGAVRVDPYDSSSGRIAVLRDPTGARFAVIDQSVTIGDHTMAANYDPYED